MHDLHCLDLSQTLFHNYMILYCWDCIRQFSCFLLLQQTITVLHLLHWSRWSAFCDYNSRPTDQQYLPITPRVFPKYTILQCGAPLQVQLFVITTADQQEAVTLLLQLAPTITQQMRKWTLYYIEIQIQQGWNLVRNTLPQEILPPEVKPLTADKGQVEGRVWWKAPAGKIRKQKGAEIDPTTARP